MKLGQCWDDGVTTDVRLVALLRRHGAQATLNLNAGLHPSEAGYGVWRDRLLPALDAARAQRR